LSSTFLMTFSAALGPVEGDHAVGPGDPAAPGGGDVLVDEPGDDQEVKDRGADEHREADAHARDDAGGDEQDAGLKAEGGNFLARDLAQAVVRQHLGQAPGENLVEERQGALGRVEDADAGADDDAADQGIGLFERLASLGVQASESFRRRHAGGESQLLVIDHLALERDGQEDAHKPGAEGENSDDPDGGDIPGLDGGRVLSVAGEEEQRAEHGGDGGAGGVARRRCGGLHAVVLEDGHLRKTPAGQAAGGVPDHERHDARRDRHAERPADGERGVEV
jgi:hypothetical protein